MAIKSLAFLLVLFFQLPALGCTPVKSIGMLFDWNSSRISSKQVFRLASWIADQRRTYPNRQAIYFSASADEKEHQPERLAWARALVLQQVVTNLGFTADALHLPEKVDVVKAGSFGAGANNDVKRADVELLPDCPHECACQLKL